MLPRPLPARLAALFRRKGFAAVPDCRWAGQTGDLAICRPRVTTTHDLRYKCIHMPPVNAVAVEVSKSTNAGENFELSTNPNVSLFALVSYKYACCRRVRLQR